MSTSWLERLPVAWLFFIVSMLSGCAVSQADEAEKMGPTLQTVGTSHIAAGYGHSCVIEESGALLCWGHNGFGQLGLEDPGDWKSNQLAALPDRPIALTAGAYHTCILTAAGVYCWGQNSTGQLGDGTQINRPSLALVSTLPDSIVQVDGGDPYLCPGRR